MVLLVNILRESNKNIFLFIELVSLGSLAIILIFSHTLARSQKNYKLLKSIIRFLSSNKIVIVCTITFIGLIIRSWNLAALPIAEDEYNHLVAIIHQQNNGDFYYTRAKAVSFSQDAILRLKNHTPILNDTTLSSIRLPSVIVGSISIVLVYILGSYVNAWVGLISATLFSLSPFAIGMSRYAREYSFFGMLFLAACASLVKIALVINEKNTKEKARWLLWLSLIVTIIFGYYLKLEIGSTLRVLMILIPTLLLAVIIYFFKKSYIHRFSALSSLRKFTFLFLLIFLMSIFTFYVKKDTFLASTLTSTSYDPRFLQSYIDSSFIYYESFSGFFNTPSTYPRISIIILFLAPLLMYRRKKFSLIFYYLTWAAITVGLALMSKGFQGRYLYYNYPFFLIIVSTSLYLLFRFFYRKTNYAWFLVVGLFFFINVPKGIVMTLQETNWHEKVYGQSNKIGILDPKTGIVHRTDTIEAINALDSKIVVSNPEEYIVIVDNRSLFMYFYSKQIYQDVILWNTIYGPQYSLEKIKSVIAENNVLLVVTKKTIDEYGSSLVSSDINSKEINLKISKDLRSNSNNLENAIIERTYFVYPEKIVIN